MKRSARLPAIAVAAVLGAVTLVACSSSSDDTDPTPTPETTAAPEPTERQTATPAATTAPAATVDASNVTIIMRRGPCFGACPQYRLTVRGDGSFDFEGIADVGFIGATSDTMPPEDIQRLVERFDKIGFADLDDFYRCLATDLPTTVTSISRGPGSEKSVSRCALSSAPDSLIALENLIDELTNSQRWVDRTE